MKLMTALFVAVIGFGIAMFGVVRGLSETGPSHGTRMIVSVSASDETALRFAREAAAMRVEEKGTRSRVVLSGQGFVVELGDDDPQNAKMVAAILERVGHVELRDGDATIDARTLRRIWLDDQGVGIEASLPLPFKVRSPVSFVLDGKVKLAATPDKIDGTTMHVAMPADEALQVRDILVTGAAPPMHVASSAPFTRSTGFWPRASVFLAIGGVLLAGAAATLLVGKRRHQLR